MDRFFDRVGDVLRNLLGEQGSGTRAGASGRTADPDLAAAWEELEGFLDDDGDHSDTRGSQSDETSQSRADSTRGAAPTSALKRDYATLEVPVGAPFTEVRRSYRRLMREHHPDRFGGDARAQQQATARAARINAAYQRIQAESQ